MAVIPENKVLLSQCSYVLKNTHFSYEEDIQKRAIAGNLLGLKNFSNSVKQLFNL
jgi:hypothetical protein